MRLAATILFAWTSLAVAIALVIGRLLSWLGDCEPDTQPEPVDVGSDLDWLDDLPVECLSDDEVSARFEQLVGSIR